MMYLAPPGFVSGGAMLLSWKSRNEEGRRRCSVFGPSGNSPMGSPCITPGRLRWRECFRSRHGFDASSCGSFRVDGGVRGCAAGMWPSLQDEGSLEGDRWRVVVEMCQMVKTSFQDFLSRLRHGLARRRHGRRRPVHRSPCDGT